MTSYRLPEQEPVSGDDGRAASLSSLWDFSADAFCLERDQVHLWQMSLDQNRTRREFLIQTLDGVERERASRFFFQQDRERFIVGRGMLRVILGGYLHREPNQLCFCYNPFGKPSLEAESFKAESFKNERIRFNLSHSKGLALFAFTRGREVGVDIEHIRPDVNIEEIGKLFFSPRELENLLSLPLSVQQRAFFHCWSRKEAFIKAVGKGLSMSLDQFEVSVQPGATSVTLEIPDDPLEARRWSIRSLSPGQSYVGALAVEGHQWHLRQLALG